ncbi:amylo-alpha-1,6-glucosidase [Oceanirhabdus seepicola]|uniref:Mannosylglycerate hydrolase MGH1-like glycoside hydrolase domain-containing protein n=1 Tax=Oceanirhabdus seepicola TaxID=2828781 RepID=A0A9J6P4Q0_9CLOT|nr:trehalase family glycosidase [Oceanirhabdus seepicola]MCM1991212.1 hypothetical protein [Oceanirhabdus seepicola]
MDRKNYFKGNDMIDLVTIPFSRFGSFFVISKYEIHDRSNIYIRDVRGGDLTPGRLFCLDFFQNGSIVEDYEFTCTETLLTVKRGTGKIEMFFSDEDSLRIRGEGMGLNLHYILKKYDNIFSIKEDEWELCSYSKELRIRIKRIAGGMEVKAPWDTIGNTSIDLMLTSDDEPFDIELESFKVLPKSVDKKNEDFYQSHNRVQAEYDKWTNQLLTVPEKYEEKKKIASYITWMNFVKPEGQLKKYAMYMSKNWMTNIWSWDNCFGAIFLANIHPELAYDQYMMFKDHQHDSGMYPDYINDTYASYSSAKPPIYGWAYDYMMKRNDLFRNTEKLKEVYDTVSKQTEFWMTHRLGVMGLPYYTHGNESGWDNGTLYAKGIPVITPDLSALLIYQMDFLSRIAGILEMESEKEKWIQKANSLTETFINHLWKNGEFKAFSIPNDEYIEEGDSLQLLLPLMIAYRLDGRMKKNLLKAIKDKDRFNGRYGLATEAMNSKFYQYNGYWRGPVWAPTMLMFIEALDRMGEKEVAKDLAERFTEGILIGGMAENFDPKTGEGLVDPAFAWTSSVFMTLIEDYLK